MFGFYRLTSNFCNIVAKIEAKEHKMADIKFNPIL